MKLLVTGCAGFIGANFSDYILKRYPDDIVVGVDCLTYASNESALLNLKKQKNFTFYYNNICDKNSMEEIFATERPDIVVNFAAESHVDRSIADYMPFLETNIMGVGVLLGLAEKYGVKRFHQVSTDEVYGDVALDSDEKFTEESPLNPTSPYSASKSAADLLALSFMKTHGLPVSISRSSNNYGIYQHKEKLIPKTVDFALSNKAITIYGNGQNKRDWLFVIDNCRAIDLIIRAGECDIYNVSADNHISNVELVKKIMALLGMPDGEIAFVEDRKGHDRKYATCSDKIKKLGWITEAKFESELENTVAWYKNQM